MDFSTERADKLRKVIELANRLKDIDEAIASNYLASTILEECAEIGTIQYEYAGESDELGQEYFDLICAKFGDAHQYHIPVPLLKAESAIRFYKQSHGGVPRGEHNRQTHDPSQEELIEIASQITDLTFLRPSYLHLHLDAGNDADNAWFRVIRHQLFNADSPF